MKTERIAIYTGTFDPITLGHIDIIQRGSKLFDRIIVTIAINQSKKPLFSVDDRITMIKDAIKGIKNASIEKFDGLLVDFASEKNACVILRGLRAVSDFEYEFQMALMNKHLRDDISTMFLVPDEKYTYLNSTIVKDVAKYGGDIKNFVTNFVEKKLIDKYKNSEKQNDSY
jgi:pantetheine-phosphate adenylyltransferase